MRALVWEGPRNMQLRTADDPRPGPDEVLIKVAHSGICGSELGGYLGHNSLRKPPLVMGHEFSGVVVERGSNVAEHRLPTGTRVTVNPLIPGARISGGNARAAEPESQPSNSRHSPTRQLCRIRGRACPPTPIRCRTTLIWRLRR